MKDAILLKLRLRRRIIRSPAAFAASTDGVAAVEFALILPLMVLMYLGISALTVGVNTARKVAHVSRAVADLVGREKSLDAAGLGQIVNASSAVLAPHDPTGMTISVASIVVWQKPNTDGTLPSHFEGKVCWGRAHTVTGPSESGTPTF